MAAKNTLQKRAEKANIELMNDEEPFDKFAAGREQMLKFDLKGRGIKDAKVLAVMEDVRREGFVLGSYESQAYGDGPLPIGCGQTISQPYIVALMTEKLSVDGECEVLELGTGSGYQTAILSRLAKQVYTIERFGRLSESAQVALADFGAENIEFYVGDGSCGWPEEKVFDRIMVTAALPGVPEPLARQLKDGGVMVAPVGGGFVQRLMVYEKSGQQLSERFICDVRFVKLVGEYGFRE